MKKFLSWKIPVIILAAVILGFFDLPSDTQSKLVPFTPESWTKNKIHLGLDLQGGSQLEYKIDLRKVPAEDQEDIIDGVQQVIEKRVNALGVAEPNIYRTEIAGEYHITVELAETAVITQEDVEKYLGPTNLQGEPYAIDNLTDDEKKLVSLEKAKAAVGKTIQLEFKEEKASLDPQEKEKVKENAISALDKIKGGADFSVVGQEEQQAFPGKVQFEQSPYVFADEIPEKIKDTVLKLGKGNFTKELIETGGSFTIDALSGEAVEETGLAIVKLTDILEEVKNEKEVFTSHILVTWEGLENANSSVTRSEDEAYERIKEVRKKLQEGADFAATARDYSDDPGNKDLGGVLAEPVTGDGTYVYDFEQAALAFEKPGDLSEIVKTQFGYHIIKANDVKKDVVYPKYQYEMITYSTVPDPWQDTGLTGKHFVHADVQLDNLYQPYVSILFNDEGGRLFEEITGRNVNKRIAIFVGGNFISAPNVQEKISGGSAVINGSFTSDEAKNLARDLNTGAIPAPIVLTGEYTIGATLGHEALSKSLFAGLIGLLVVMLFMVANYRLSGIIASVALAVYATILLFLIKSELHLGTAMLISLIAFGFLVVKIVNNKDSGWEKFLSFILACIAFFFLAFLLKTGIVLTLAGVAGIILSIGMAVDANILIFERFKEELQEGKSFGSAIDSAFSRAWSAIRDSNFSTLLTCAILFYFGSSIIKGFAFNLAAGILVSMFTAITITRALLKGFVGKRIAQNLKAFGVTAKEKTTFNFIQKTKTWLSLSSVLVGISILAIIVFGLNLGIDFKGGTLLQFNFSEPIQKEVLETSLNEIAAEINERPAITEEPTVEKVPAETSLETPVISTDTSTQIDLNGMKVIDSGENNYIVKTKYLTSTQHDQIIEKMKEQLPAFTEPRFTTIGPVLGSTLLQKAITAVGFALVMIIVYIGFAFRKVPKEVSPWRFGACAIIALVHDVIIVTGVFAVLGAVLNVEIDALFITAMLTVFGYSVNDTIVIFDRLRENLIKESGEDLTDTTNKALNETLRRSINTSVSTLITLIAVLFFGSSAIFYFILALTLGTIVGTYSSIFTASPLLVMWTKRAERKNASVEVVE